MGMLTRDDHVDVSIRTKPPGRHDLGRDSRLSITDGTDVGSLGEFIEFVAQRHRTRLNDKLGARFLDYYKTLADLEKGLLAEETIRPLQALWVQTAGGDRLPVVHVTARSRSSHVVAKVPVRHTEISGHLVSSGELKKRDGSSLEFFAIQRSDLPGSATVRFSPKPAAKRRRGPAKASQRVDPGSPG
jgi:hypothetical protein